MMSRFKWEALRELVAQGKEIPMIKTREPFGMQAARLLELTPKNAIVFRLTLELVKTENDLHRLIQLFKYRNKIHTALCSLRKEKTANVLRETQAAL